MPAQSNFVCLAPFFDDAFIRETRELLTAHAVLTGPGVVRFTDVMPEKSVRDAAKAKAAEAHCDSVFTPGELKLASFKAFFFDMDSTLVTTETLDEMAEICGTGEECARITAGTMQGTIKNYAESLRARVALLKGHDAQALETVRAHTKINPGVPELLKALHAHGVKTYVLSSGFTAMTKPLAESLGMTGYHSNVIGIENGLFTGEVTGPDNGPIIDAAGKLAFVEKTMKALGATPREAVCCGDGSNDILMVSAAGLGVGFRPKKVLRPYCGITLDNCGFDALLKLFAETAPRLEAYTE